MKNIIMGIEKSIFIPSASVVFFFGCFYALLSPLFIVYAHLKIIEEGYSMWLMVPAVAQSLPWFWVAGGGLKSKN